MDMFWLMITHVIIEAISFSFACVNRRASHQLVALAHFHSFIFLGKPAILANWSGWRVT